LNVVEIGDSTKATKSQSRDDSKVTKSQSIDDVNATKTHTKKHVGRPLKFATICSFGTIVKKPITRHYVQDEAIKKDYVGNRSLAKQ
jgi:hypothetical protein